MRLPAATGSWRRSTASRARRCSRVSSAAVPLASWSTRRRLLAAAAPAAGGSAMVIVPRGRDAHARIQRGCRLSFASPACPPPAAPLVCPARPGAAARRLASTGARGPSAWPCDDVIQSMTSLSLMTSMLQCDKGRRTLTLRRAQTPVAERTRDPLRRRRSLAAAAAGGDECRRAGGTSHEATARAAAGRGRGGGGAELQRRQRRQQQWHLAG